MSRITAISLALAFGLAGAACDVETETADTETVAERPGIEPATEAEPVTGGAAASLGVDSLADAGAYITDGEGRALYMLEGEPSDSATCYDACAEEWPPFMAPDAAPRATGQGLRADLVGTIERRDGSRQVTYGGHPLYYYHEDVEPGQTTGQDLTDDWGEWYLVKPDGEHLEGEG